ncbi:MAG: FtsK/SpoIIIE domain-containing protein [bacterium]|nr:FtsK/SpoIIIE domain-containing protein [bacterium]
MIPFNRPPRVPLPSLDGAHIDLPAPPPPITGGDTSWAAALIPMLSVGTMSAIYVVRTGDLLLALPMMALAFMVLIGVVVNGRARRRKHERTRAAAAAAYERALDGGRARLQAAHDAQIGILQRNFPAPSELLTIALDREPRLWNRRPADPDFAAFRVGVGEVPSAVNIRIPGGDSAEAQPAHDLAAHYRTLEHAPVPISLKSGAVGMCGLRTLLLPTARAAVVHLVTAHAPDELHLYLAADERFLESWEWLEWLPHAENRLAYDPEAARGIAHDLAAHIDERRARAGDPAALMALPFIVVIVDGGETAFRREAAYSTILRDGPALRMAILTLAPSFEVLPGECATVFEIDGSGFRVFTGANGSPAENGQAVLRGAAADTLSPRDAEHIARALVGVTPVDSRPLSDAPDRIDLLALYHVRRADDLDALLRERWSRSPGGTPPGAPGGNSALPFPFPIGMESATSVLELRLDDAHHGAHGILAGTTGSGKSELLTTLICALAIEHDPRLVNFLLIDFKGGSAFHPFAALPHTVGMVTNLDGGLIARTLTALKAETDWRQGFLKKMGVRDIAQYHRAFVAERRELDNVNTVPLPHLFIIVDEFAQLAKEMPDFLRELVRIAQVGRGLGLHLILGTQSPMDVMTDEMNANMQFRLCLRVPNIESSRAVLRRPDAAYIPASQVGRGYFQVGDGGIFRAFQAAFVGGDYDRETRRPAARDPYGTLELVTATGKSINLRPPLVNTPAPGAAYTAAHAIIETISAFARAECIPAARPILLPPLPDRITLDAVYAHIGAGGWNGRGWLAAGRDHEGRPIPPGSAPIGLIDDVENRVQLPLWVHLWARGDAAESAGSARREGHLLIVGAPGSGKTALLRALAFSLALLHPPDKLHLYTISFTGAGLSAVGKLPHAEKGMMSADGERIRRLFARLIRILEARQAEAGMSDAPSPLVLVMVDQYEGLREFMRDDPALSGQFERLIVEGRAAGIAFALTASSGDVIPERLRGLIRQRIALGMGEAAHYLNVIGRVAPLEAAPPGRGYWYASPPLLCQVALASDQPLSDHLERAARTAPAALYTSVNPSAAALEAVIAERMTQTADAMRAAYHDLSGRPGAPDAVLPLPRQILLRALFDLPENGHRPATSALSPLIGRWDDDALSPYRHDMIGTGGAALVIGAPGTGKTNLLLAAALSMAHAAPPERLRLIVSDVDQRGWALMRDLPHVLAYAPDAQELAHIAGRLAADLEALDDAAVHTAVFFDQYDTLLDLLRYNPDALAVWRDLLRRYGGERLSVWVATYGDRLNDPLLRFMTLRRGGFALGGRDALARLNLRVAGLSADPLPPGRAYLPLPDGGIGVVQTAWVDDLTAALAQIRRRWDRHPRAAWAAHSAPRPAGEPSRTTAPAFDDGVSDIDVRGLIDDLLKGNRS